MQIRAGNALAKVCKVFWLLFYIAAFVLSIIGYIWNLTALSTVFKSMFMPCISLLAYFLWPRPLTKPYYLLQCAFVMAWLGDVLIGLSLTWPVFFVPGGYAFFCQHAFYIWLNLLACGSPSSLLSVPYWGLPHLPYFMLLTISYFSKVHIALRIQHSIYAVMLCTSFLTAFYRTAWEGRRAKYFLTVCGFGAFVCSDILISIDAFMWRLSQLEGAAILLTYYVAQTMICLGVTPEKPEDYELGKLVVKAGAVSTPREEARVEKRRCMGAI